MRELEAPDPELAQQLVKDPYVLGHLGLVERIAERDVEHALMDRPQDTMLELGRGMAFVGRQVRLTAPGDASDRVEEFGNWSSRGSSSRARQGGRATSAPAGFRVPWCPTGASRRVVARR
ncbi:PDDEXK nuclease domain-containing protein [Cellulosimicrobium sp. Marseille-Q8652]